jgi:glucose/arabinose dehydrogenase
MASFKPLCCSLLMSLLCAGCASPRVSQAGPAVCCQEQPASTSIDAEVIVSGLQRPWGMAFLPDGSILVTERGGSMRRVVDGSLSAPLTGVPTVKAAGQGGLLDIALDPDFGDNRTLYLSYAEPNETGRASTAVARAQIDDDYTGLQNVETIFSANNKSSGGRHFGSRLRFAPDNTLYVTVGDRGTQMRAQDPFDHAGSVVRINRDGSVPSDNPYADGNKALPEIWSTGHRNPQGAAIHPVTGELWTLSHGAAGGDELNRPQAGRNYGWPVISYGSNYSGRGFDKGVQADGFEQPAYYWDPSIAPSGLAFYSPDASIAKIPAWSGSLLAGALKFQHLSRLIFNRDGSITEERYLEGEFGRIRDVRSGPDGAVWLLTDSGDGKLIRLTAP